MLRSDMTFSRQLALLALLVGGTTVAQADELRQRIGGYEDNQGLTRQRYTLDMTSEGPSTSQLATNFALNVALDRFQTSRAASDDSVRKIYGSAERRQQTVGLTALQTWNRTAETRVGGVFLTDGEITSRSWTLGVSQWLRKETIRLSLDVSRTLVDQPVVSILDYDAQTLTPPSLVTSSGVRLAVRHLATPTLVMDYSADQVLRTDRPAAQTYAVAGRRFFPSLDAALHASLARAFNRGRIDTTTTYGEVDAWIADTAWLQTLWSGGRARFGYRYYQELEVTRAFEDELQLGSDTLTVGIAQDAKVAKGQPVTLEVAGSRYFTNTKVIATVIEAGLQARF